MAKSSAAKDSNEASKKSPEEADHTKPDYGPWKERKRPPGSQAGRYKRFDKSIPSGAERVLVPTKNDVVFGRGKGSHDHPGNRRMREIIRRHKKDYSAIHRSKKRQIAELVYSEITQNGARFLHRKRGEEAYAVVDLNLALQKLSNTLRCRKSCLIGDEDENEETVAASSSAAFASAPGAVTIQPRRDAAGFPGAVPPAVLAPPVGGLVSAAALHQEALSAGAASMTAQDSLLRRRYLAGLARPEYMLPPTSLAAERELWMGTSSLAAERELLFRRSALGHPYGAGGAGSLLGSSLLASDPLLSAPPMSAHERYSEMMAAEQEYLLARRRLRNATLGL
ncbi:unnamed protein product [Cylindrotheca closterium]|uniref:DUF6824 domain-containing protein n=1 Tax=Cylindrotheca closterium TaxID=2856 RepID=A0AAD2FKB7_9STRA|nr:unnamed protein product [Cylindrotheca closterium]